MSEWHHVAVVGAGPAGIFAAAALLKHPKVRVDVFERLVAPYGLVRYGVAPDHQKIKSVEAGFARTLADERVRYFGNVELGRDLHLAELREMYDQVVFAMGCEAPRHLGVEGERVRGVHTALEFVSWYNGHPDYVGVDVDLDVSKVVIVGAGDVSMDLTRLLSSSPAELRQTDMPDYAIERFARSRIDEIRIVIRRGPSNANFALKELSAVVERDDVRVCCDEQLLRDTLAGDLPNAQRSKLEYLLEQSRTRQSGAIAVHFDFLRSPTRFVAREGRLSGVVLEKNRLVPSAEGEPKAVGTSETETLDAGLALLAVGYRGTNKSGAPVDERSGLISNEEGQVRRADGTLDPQCYVVGWLKRGPQGVIGTNKGDAKATVDRILANLGSPNKPVPDVAAKLAGRRVQFVDFASWSRLDEIERQRGEKSGKPREKFLRADDALASLSHHVQPPK